MSAAAVAAPMAPTKIFRVANGRLGKDLPPAAVAACAGVDIISYGDWECTVWAAPKEAYSTMDAFAEAAHSRARSADKPRETCKPHMTAEEFFAFCHITFKHQGVADAKKPWEDGYVAPKPKGPAVSVTWPAAAAGCAESVAAAAARTRPVSGVAPRGLVPGRPTCASTRSAVTPLVRVCDSPSRAQLNGAAILPGYRKAHGLKKCEALRYTGNDVFVCGTTDTHYILCLYWTS